VRGRMAHLKNKLFQKDECSLKIFLVRGSILGEKTSWRFLTFVYRFQTTLSYIRSFAMPRDAR
jgi:hypothetical protein